MKSNRLQSYLTLLQLRLTPAHELCRALLWCEMLLALAAASRGLISSPQPRMPVAARFDHSPAAVPPAGLPLTADEMTQLEGRVRALETGAKPLHGPGSAALA